MLQVRRQRATRKGPRASRPKSWGPKPPRRGRATGKESGRRAAGEVTGWGPVWEGVGWVSLRRAVLRRDHLGGGRRDMGTWK